MVWGNPDIVYALQKIFTMRRWSYHATYLDFTNRRVRSLLGIVRQRLVTRSRLVQHVWQRTNLPILTIWEIHMNTVITNTSLSSQGILFCRVSPYFVSLCKCLCPSLKCFTWQSPYFLTQVVLKIRCPQSNTHAPTPTPTPTQTQTQTHTHVYTRTHTQTWTQQCRQTIPTFVSWFQDWGWFRCKKQLFGMFAQSSLKQKHEERKKKQSCYEWE